MHWKKFMIKYYNYNCNINLTSVNVNIVYTLRKKTKLKLICKKNKNPIIFFHDSYINIY